MPDGTTFVKIIRKDKINMSSFASVEANAEAELVKVKPSDVLALTISNSLPFRLVRVEKVTQEVFACLASQQPY